MLARSINFAILQTGSVKTFVFTAKCKFCKDFAIGKRFTMWFIISEVGNLFTRIYNFAIFQSLDYNIINALLARSINFAILQTGSVKTFVFTAKFSILQRFCLWQKIYNVVYNIRSWKLVYKDLQLRHISIVRL